MEGSRYRVHARAVALFDLIVTSMHLWIPIALFFPAAGLTIASTSSHEPEVKTTKDYMDWKDLLGAIDDDEDDHGGLNQASLKRIALWLWAAFFVATLLWSCQMTAAIKLLNASQIGKHPRDAIRQSEFWRSMTLCVTSFTIVIGFLYEIHIAAVIISAIIALLKLYIVQVFINELKAMISYDQLLPIKDNVVASRPFETKSDVGKLPPSDDDVDIKISDEMYPRMGPSGVNDYTIV